MKTITLKTDDTFFHHVTQLANSLHLSKSELIRRSIKEYERNLKKQKLKEQIMQASFNVRQTNAQLIEEFDTAVGDGLDNA